MDRTSLADLCAICHTAPPRYRCPRCSIRTCSAPCYKQHQRRAACDGKRDPAAFVKKSAWATPAGVDRDYNYLKGLERTIDRADDDARQLDDAAEAASSRNTARARLPGSAFQSYLARNGIVVINAPKGMSRQRSNQSRAARQKVLWTVEWVDDGGKAEVQHDCLDSSTVPELYQSFLAQKRNAEKRAALSEAGSQQKQAGKKRKRKPCPSDDPEKRAVESTLMHGEITSQAPELTSDEVEPTSNIQQQPGNSTAASADHLEHLRPHLSPPAPEPESEDEDQQAGKAINRPGPQCSHEDRVDLTPSASAEARQQPPSCDAAQPKPHSTAKHHFYLLKTGTATASKVLIPLPRLSSLTECLYHQTVQEYPTIYVLPDSPEALQDGFVPEEVYLRSIKPTLGSEASKAISGDGVHARMTVQGHGAARQEATQELDAKAILDMLKRDVTI